MFDATEHRDTLVQIRDYLRKVWDEPDSRRRDWYLFRLRETYQLAIAFASEEAKDFQKKLPLVTLNLLSGYLKGEHAAARDRLLEEVWDYRRRVDEAYEPPAPSALEAALYFLQDRLRGLTKHCGNPDCPAPYFIAKKRWQRYCSEECAGPAARESKRQWWRQNRAKDGGLE
jgi:hypothetical protein